MRALILAVALLPLSLSGCLQTGAAPAASESVAAPTLSTVPRRLSLASEQGKPRWDVIMHAPECNMFVAQNGDSWMLGELRGQPLDLDRNDSHFHYQPRLLNQISDAFFPSHRQTTKLKYMGTFDTEQNARLMMGVLGCPSVPS